MKIPRISIHSSLCLWVVYFIFSVCLQCGNGYNYEGDILTEGSVETDYLSYNEMAYVSISNGEYVSLSFSFTTVMCGKIFFVSETECASDISGDTTIDYLTDYSCGTQNNCYSNCELTYYAPEDGCIVATNSGSSGTVTYSLTLGSSTTDDDNDDYDCDSINSCSECASCCDHGYSCSASGLSVACSCDSASSAGISS